MENIILIALGVLLSIIGVINMTGNISTIHSYNRTRVSEEDRPKYGRAVGAGTLIIGVAVAICGVLTICSAEAAVPFVFVPALIVGLAFMLYGQFKYNKGLF